MSTCTPVVYNHRAYIGVSGTGQFKAYTGHNLTVIDLRQMADRLHGAHAGLRADERPSDDGL